MVFSKDYKFPIYTSKLSVSSSLFTIMLCFVSMKIKKESRLRCVVCFSFYYLKDLWLWLGMFVLHSIYIIFVLFCLFSYLIFMCTLGVLMEVNMQIYVLCCVHEFVHLLFYKKNQSTALGYGLRLFSVLMFCLIWCYLLANLGSLFRLIYIYIFMIQWWVPFGEILSIFCWQRY